jgi:hypothetical protein
MIETAYGVKTELPPAEILPWLWPVVAYVDGDLHYERFAIMIVFGNGKRGDAKYGCSSIATGAFIGTIV